MDDSLEPQARRRLQGHPGRGRRSATVIAVTYPQIFQPGPGGSCLGDANLPVPDVQFLISAGLYLDNTIIYAAKAAGINVLDERYALLGHQLCSSAPWVYQLPTGFTSGTGSSLTPVPGSTRGPPASIRWLRIWASTGRPCSSPWHLPRYGRWL